MKKYIPQIIFLLFSSTLVMTYFTNGNVVPFQIVIYLLILIGYAFSKKSSRGIDGNCKLYIAFTIIYFLRIFYDLEFAGIKQQLYGSDFTVYFFVFNGIIFPAIFFPLIMNEKTYKYSFIGLGIFLLYSLSISFYNFLTGNVFLTPDHRMMANEFLGVIQYGHLGLTSIIVGVYFFKNIRNSKIYLFFSILLLLLGVISVFLSGTRSAIVAVLLIVVLYMIAKVKIKVLLQAILLLVPFVIFADDILALFGNTELNSANRIFSLFEDGGDQSSGRTAIWAFAFHDISYNLLTGVSSFFKFHDYFFVHNSVIEITYALGIVGCCVFLHLNLAALKICIKIFKGNNADYICLSSLFIQYFVFGLFSESIMRLTMYWVLLAVVLSINVLYKRTCINNKIYEDRISNYSDL